MKAQSNLAVLVKQIFVCLAASATMQLLVSRFRFVFSKLSRLFSWIYATDGKRVPKGCWHTTGVTFGKLFRPCLEADMLLPLSGVGEEWNA